MEHYEQLLIETISFKNDVVVTSNEVETPELPTSKKSQ